MPKEKPTPEQPKEERFTLLAEFGSSDKSPLVEIKVHRPVLERLKKLRT